MYDIPVNDITVDRQMQANVTEAMTTGWISSGGGFLAQFEEKWAAYCGQSHGIACSNGTTALQIAFDAIGLAEGDEVILPTHTIISCLLPVLRAGAVPVFVDVDPQTFCIDEAQAVDAITERTKAILVVHMYGHPAAMEQILPAAKSRGIYVIEDAAEVHGGSYVDSTGQRHICGSQGDIATFSFYVNKLITTGEGGMAITSNPELAAEMRADRNLHFNAERRFKHYKLGQQYRLTNVQAALGLPQVDNIEQIVARKREIRDYYHARLQQHQDMIILPKEADWATSVYWVYYLLFKPEYQHLAKGLQAHLKEARIETRPFFYNLHSQPLLEGEIYRAAAAFPVSEWLQECGFYIPCGLAITEEQMDKVVAQIDAYLSTAG